MAAEEAQSELVGDADTDDYRHDDGARGFDIIGDVHGSASKLECLLERLGYARCSITNAYQHPERRAVFVGDIIDKGDEQLETLQLVKAMVDCGAADLVMGNHEFNAIIYATTDSDSPARQGIDASQLRAFLQLSDNVRAEYVEWFLTLPLYLELRVQPFGASARVVHACWHEGSIREIRPIAESGRLAPSELLRAADRKGNLPLYRAVTTLLNGPEVDLGRYGPVVFGGSHKRTSTWVRWWDSTATTLRDLAFTRGAATVRGARFPELPRNDSDAKQYVYADMVPVFYGHYTREWRDRSEDLTTYTACVDLSGGEGGVLAAYRWNGESTLSVSNYVAHDPDVESGMP